ncbi:odorant receptor Or2-like [Ceratina calcarata]|uniref:Odorant receptor n=1 Tax=Ceratina calcarata TaxID=156304 RepID=A0AAJ7N5R2_9HYME|nr:odorant receptor Or2-like [Ceratina calcarata]
MDKIIPTETAQKDIKYATQLVKRILSIVGAWPVLATSSFSKKLAQKIKNFISYFLILLLLIPGLAQIFLKEKETKVKLRLMAAMINAGMQFSKYTLLLYHEKKIIHGLNLIKKDWMSATSENRLIFLEKTKIGRRIVLIAASTIYSSGLGYRIFLPLSRGTIVTPDNITIRPLPCPSYFIFIDEQQTPRYEILFVLQIMAGFVTYTVIAGSCGICALMVLHACSMQRILMNKMRDLVEGAEISETAVVHQKIADIVDYQTKINEFVRNIQGITEYICLSEMLGGTCLVCLLEYCTLLEWENKNTTGVVVYIMLITSFTFSIFVLCNIGQLLVDESNDAGKTSSTLEWYRMQAKQAHSLILIIAMSNYPMKLTAGKVMEMSLTTFTDVIKLSLGYMNMLRQVV